MLTEMIDPIKIYTNSENFVIKRGFNSFLFSDRHYKNFLRKERSEVSYYRTLPLPEKVHSGQAKAKLIDGVLDVVIQKITPTSKPQKRLIRVQ